MTHVMYHVAFRDYVGPSLGDPTSSSGAERPGSESPEKQSSSDCALASQSGSESDPFNFGAISHSRGRGAFSGERVEADLGLSVTRASFFARVGVVVAHILIRGPSCIAGGPSRMGP